MTNFVNRQGSFDFTAFSLAAKWNAANFTVSPTNIHTNLAGAVADFGGSYDFDASGNLTGGSNRDFRFIVAGVPQFAFSGYELPLANLSAAINRDDAPSFFAAILAGNDVLTGADGQDHLTGLGGDDLLAGGAGADTLDGGAGRDTADYSAAAAAVSVNLLAGTASDGFGASDTLVSIENLLGSFNADLLIGDALDNGIRANGGNDLIGGGEGSDEIRAGSGADGLDLGGGNDRGFGESGDDVIDGGSGDDHAEGGAGADRIRGGLGADLAYGGGGNDAMGGQEGNDALYGGGGNDILDGGVSGNDILDGGFGNDILSGGDGRNSMAGGAGRDRFIIAAHGNAIDTITDFNPAFDRIQLTATTPDAALATARITDGGSAFFDLGGGQYLVVNNLQGPNANWFA